MPTKTCIRCGDIFEKPRNYSSLQWEKREHCSRSCGVWNKGLTSHTDPRLARIAEQMAIISRGRPGWNKGLTKHTDQRLAIVSAKVSATQRGRKASEAQKRGLESGRQWCKGRTGADTPSLRARAAITATKLRGRKNPEHSQRQRERYAKSPELHPNAILARRGRGNGMTRIERVVAEILSRLGAEYEFNGRVGRLWPDFKLASAGLLIEADGERWHQDPEREARRDAAFRADGWRVLHLPGSLINGDPARCQALIVEAIADGQLHRSVEGVHEQG